MLKTFCKQGTKDTTSSKLQVFNTFRHFTVSCEPESVNKNKGVFQKMIKSTGIN